MVRINTVYILWTNYGKGTEMQQILLDIFCSTKNWWGSLHQKLIPEHSSLRRLGQKISKNRVNPPPPLTPPPLEQQTFNLYQTFPWCREREQRSYYDCFISSVEEPKSRRTKLFSGACFIFGEYNTCSIFGEYNTCSIFWEYNTCSIFREYNTCSIFGNNVLAVY